MIPIYKEMFNCLNLQKRIFLVLLFFATAAVTVNAQSYFQQEVNYRIEVKLNDREHTLSGNIEFDYINNSPDTLRSLFIHLWPNAYKNNQTALAKQMFAQRDYSLLRMPESSRGYIDSLQFSQDEYKLATWFDEDIAEIALAKPILPGGRTTIKTPFFVKIPSGRISRLGHIGQSYQITQWYPKPAVYDKDGWHPMPYLTQGEFYSEFGSFDVKITLPDNYIVGATGDLQTQSEMDWMNQLAEKPLMTKGSEFPASSEKLKTLHYKQDRVHDFGWFADKRWNVRKSEVELPYSKRKVTTWALFTPAEAVLWDKTALQSINETVYNYSKWVGDYPYNVCTAVDGTISAGGGMEYPTITVIGSSGDESSLKTVIVHEVGHNWFYGILGSNERDNPWMDEGINSFFETRTMIETSDKERGPELNVGGLKLGERLGLNKFSYQYLSEEMLYLLSARLGKDQPIQAHSADYTQMNYGIIVYKKSSLAFNYLMNYLGEEVFDRCMHAYFEEWKFKHPTPNDLRDVFEKTSGKNLSWFFDKLIKTTEHVDYRAASVKMKDGGYQLRVTNPGMIPGPFAVDVIRDGKQVSRQWFEGIENLTSTKVQLQAQKGDVLIVNNLEGIPEYNKQNNRIRTSGIFKKQEPLSLKMLTRIDDPRETQLFWMPLVGWNNYNKWMLGVQLHNQTIPHKNFTWSLAPMYSVASNTLNGFARVGYDDGKFAFGISGQRFGYLDSQLGLLSYTVIRPKLKVNLLPNRIKKNVKSFLEFEYIRPQADRMVPMRGPIIQPFTEPWYSYYEIAKEPYNVFRSSFYLSERMLRSDASWKSSIVWTGAFFHEHSAYYNYIYRGKGKKAIRTRLYYGANLSDNDYMFFSVLGQNGWNDYALDGLFLGRSETEGILASQFLRTQGALAVPTKATATELLTLNLEFDLPVALPLGIYAGAAYTSTPYLLDDFLWNAGVTLPLVRNIFQIYIPVIYSNQIKDEFKVRDLKFAETIMFELNLPLMNPFELIKHIEL